MYLCFTLLRASQKSHSNAQPDPSAFSTSRTGFGVESNAEEVARTGNGSHRPLYSVSIDIRIRIFANRADIAVCRKRRKSFAVALSGRSNATLPGLLEGNLP